VFEKPIGVLTPFIVSAAFLIALVISRKASCIFGNLDTGFRPNLLDNLPFQSATSQPPQAPVAVTLQENTSSTLEPVQAPAEEASREATSAHAEAVATGGKQGEFYRYTDENGTIHLLDNPENIPEKHRQQTKVYNSQKQTTPVRVVNSQVLVPVTRNRPTVFSV
jgi:hypothetical protein